MVPAVAGSKSRPISVGVSAGVSTGGTRSSQPDRTATPNRSPQPMIRDNERPCTMILPHEKSRLAEEAQSRRRIGCTRDDAEEQEGNMPLSGFAPALR